MGLQNIPGYIALQSDAVTPTNHPVELDRTILGVPVAQAGIVNANNGNPFGASPLFIAPGGGNLQIATAPFHAQLKGATTGQGYYDVYSDTGDTVAINAPSVDNRIDTLLVCVGDPEYGSVTSSRWGAKYAWATGVHGSSPVALTDAQIAAASVVPGAWLPLADVLIVPADATRVIPAASITRRWPWAYSKAKTHVAQVASGGTFAASNVPQTVSTFQDWGFPKNAVMYVTATVSVQCLTANATSYIVKFLMGGVVQKTVTLQLPGTNNGPTFIESTASIPLVNTAVLYNSQLTFSVTVENAFAPSGSHGSWNSAVVTYKCSPEAVV